MNLTWLSFCNLLRNPLNLTWLCTKASWNLLRNLRNPVEPDLALHQSLPDLLRNLLRNPVEPPGFALKPPTPDLALHQSLPDLLRNLLRNPVEPHRQTFSGTLSATFSGTFSRTFSGTFYGTSLNLARRLHQCTPELFWAEDPISLRCWGIKKINP